MPLLKRAAPFDDPDWIFELKYDGFRALAVIENRRTRLVSRNGHPFASFAALAESISDSLPNVRAVIGGEICTLDKRGRLSINGADYSSRICCSAVDEKGFHHCPPYGCANIPLGFFGGNVTLCSVNSRIVAARLTMGMNEKTASVGRTLLASRIREGISHQESTNHGAVIKIVPNVSCDVLMQRTVRVMKTVKTASFAVMY